MGKSKNALVKINALNKPDAAENKPFYRFIFYKKQHKNNNKKAAKFLISDLWRKEKSQDEIANNVILADKRQIILIF